MIEEYCPEVEVVGMAASAQEARTLIKEHDPNIIFLDIKMPREDGFSLLKSLPNSNFSVVFTTAHNDFALNAFKVNAVDYIEKPIAIDDLKNAVSKLSVIHKTTASSTTDATTLKNVAQTIVYSREYEKIIIPTSDGFILAKSTEIVHLNAVEGYTEIHLTGQRKHLSSKGIKWYEELLNPSLFFRVHKSHIINIMCHFVEFNRTEGNIAIMSNGNHIPVARRKLPEFLERVNTF